MKLVLTFVFFLFSYMSFSQSWTQKSNFGGVGRHRSTAFSIGNKGYLGLGHINSVVNTLYDDFWEYDPSSNSWTQKANYPYLCYHATGFAIGNKGYVGTGRKQDNSYTTDFFEYNPITNTWVQVSSFPGTQRRGAVAFVVNNKGYVGTGQTTGGGSNSFFSYDPNTNSWSSIADFPGSSRTSSVAFSIDTIGYVGTGDSGGGTNDLWAYNSSTDTWQQKANVGPVLRQEATGFSVNGKGYIGTGDDFSSGTNYGDMWEYDPNTDTWIQIEDFSGTPRRYLVSMVIENVAYVGTGTSGANFNDFWRFDIGLNVSEKPKLIEINTFPNPSTEKITIKLPTELEGTKNIVIKLYSISGKLMQNRNVSNNEIVFLKSNIGEGKFLIVLQNDTQIISTKVIIFK